MDLPLNIDQPEPKQTTLCKLCLTQQAKYTCPRCNIPYCTAECYKCQGHASCSEMFYRDCFMEGLKDMQAPEEKVKVMEMLKRVHDQNQDTDSYEDGDDLDSDDDADGLDLAERLKGLDLDHDTDKVWACLTEEERAEFDEMVKDGRLAQLVPAWTPWWMEKQDNSLITEIKEDAKDNSGPGSPHSTSADQPSLDDILKQKSPSEKIKYNVVNIIYGFAYVTKHYNGDHLVDPIESSQYLLAMSPALSSAAYSSVTEAVYDSINALNGQARDVYVSEEYTVDTMEDLERILVGPTSREPLLYVVRALSEVNDLFVHATTCLSQAVKAHKSTKESPDRKNQKQKSLDSTKSARRDCFHVTKKMDFLLAWCRKHGHLLQPLLPEIKLLHAEMDFHLQHYKITGDKLHQLMEKNIEDSKKSLIEEVTNS